IYSALGVTALYALGATPLALALAGVVFVCTVLTYAEMSSAFPESGGSASFARHAFNDLMSFIAGWALLLDYIVTIAISAYTVGPYLSYFFPILKTPLGNIPFSMAVIGILLAINVLGVKESTRVSLTLCAFDILTQATLIVIGALMLFNLPHLLDYARIGVPNVEWSPTWPQFWKGVGMAMVAYIGIESIAQLGGEARHADRKVPRAQILTMVTLLVMYLGISSVALSAIHPRELSTTYLEDPLAGIVAAMPVGQEFFRPWIGILGATILFVAANAGLIGASRLTFSMGEHFQLPRLFYRLHPRFHTPHVSLMFFSAIACAVIVVAKRLVFLADLYNFGAMLAFFLAHLSLIGLRVRHPQIARPFKIKGNLRIAKAEIPITALIGLLGTLAVWVDVILTKPAGRNLGFLWMGIGVLAYLRYRSRQKLPAAARVELEKLTLPGYQEAVIRKILVPTINTAANEPIQFAAKLAKLHGAELTALHVIEIPPALPLDTFFPEKLGMADSILEQAQAISREYEVPIDSQIKQARFAGETIVELAKEGAYDLIILSDKPRVLAAAPGRTTFGTTVEYVMKNAPCRVWIFTGKEPSPARSLRE
ncbi:MAG: universal stress protein, partial [Candidatus Omnitrophota bacterium]|nr:universal stress protein [Candidatus Omnitrophota bacterium]